jgi:predicted nucleic acid-binding protein
VLAGIDDALSRHAVIGLDTMLFVYYLEDRSRLTDLAVSVLDRVESGTITAVTSEITIMELMIRPLQLGRSDIASGYEDLLTNYPNLTITALPRIVIRQSAELRARHGLHALDAL